MANKTYKMIVPKAGTSNELGTDTMLYASGEVYEAKEDFQKDLMETFVENGFAMEVKVEAVEQEGEPVRARNEKGQLEGDNPDTPDVNEAWEGGEAPVDKTKKKRTTKKKAS